MNLLYFILVALSLYGDMFKRYIPAQAALATLYGLSVAILIWLILNRTHQKRLKLIRNQESDLLCKSIYFISIIYILHFLLGSNNAPFLAGLTYILYIFVPLFYSVVVIKCWPDFNITKFSNIYHLLMIPINIIGLIQYKINPNFLIDKTYAATGGVIERNLFAGSFLRLPSIFVSADRYSAIGLIQFYLAFFLLLNQKQNKRTNVFWIFFNFISGFIAMFISGARSRLIIVIAVLIIFTLTIIKGLLSGYSFNWLNNFKYSFKKLFTNILVLGLMLIFILLYYPEILNALIDEIYRFPIVTFLQDSFTKGDVEDRVNVTIARSLVPDDIPWFGTGIGSFGDRPGEYSLAQTWAESGIFWGFFKLIGFIGIMFAMLLKAFQGFVVNDPVKVAVFTLPALAILTGLLTGLTGVLELSSGVMLAVAVGAIMQYDNQSKINNRL